MQAYEPGCRRSAPVGNGKILGKNNSFDPSPRRAQVRAPGKALPTSVQGRPGISRRRLVIAGSFEVPRSAWARR